MEHDLERLRLQVSQRSVYWWWDSSSFTLSVSSFRFLTYFQWWSEAGANFEILVKIFELQFEVSLLAFEIQYRQWVEEQMKQVSELRNALNTHKSDSELQILVDTSIKHYADLFQLKAAAAKADVFYLMSGMWTTSSERVFLWLGGVRPSGFLKILLPQLDPLTELQQLMDVCNLKQSCEQAEEALSQGVEKLLQRLAQSVAEHLLQEGNYRPESPEMTNATDKLEALNITLNQADFLRRETLQQMRRILTTKQAASGFGSSRRVLPPSKVS
ncbi:transcription factor TGA4-like [Silene latifolia]|uniref:transcription factor TGA4-like n=1 Tax=Silene latifolia TaxID=37657 RepID=UPI003D7888B4